MTVNEAWNACVCGFVVALFATPVFAQGSQPAGGRPPHLGVQANIVFLSSSSASSITPRTRRS
jgi:hypothetical protein